MPRSPSTVRVTGVVATTSRASPLSSGSSSTTLCTSVVAPPTSTTTTSPAPGCWSSRPRASSSTPVRTTSGVAPRTRSVKVRPCASVRLLRCLPPMTWDRNISRIAARALSGASTPIRGTTLSARTWGVPASSRSAAIVACDSTLPATTTGPGHGGPREEVGVALEHLGVAAVGAADQQHDVGLRGPQVGELAGVEPAGEHQHDLAAAGQRDPTPRLGGDQLLVADHRDPQAAAGAGAGEHVGVGWRRVLLGQRAQAGVVPVEHVTMPRLVREGGRVARGGEQVTGVEVDQGRLGEGGAEVDADDRAHTSTESPASTQRTRTTAATTRGTALPRGRGRPSRMAASACRNRFQPTTDGQRRGDEQHHAEGVRRPTSPGAGAAHPTAATSSPTAVRS